MRVFTSIQAETRFSRGYEGLRAFNFCVSELFYQYCYSLSLTQPMVSVSMFIRSRLGRLSAIKINLL